MKIPNPNRKRALIVVDMQSGFLPEHARWIIPNIQRVIEKGNYAICIEALFHADTGSIWEKQTDWKFDFEPTIKEIKDRLPDGTVTTIKTTKSAFQGNNGIVGLFKENEIEEIHIVGVDANDCVLATAYDSFDAGYFTYVIEECVESSGGPELRDAALFIMRKLDLTNYFELVPESIEV